jgi:hypothetical protein
MFHKKLFERLVLVALGAILLAGCRAEEQGRVLRYEPGIYKGKTFTQLTASQRKTLRQRSIYQGTGMASFGGTSVQRNVRKPTVLSESSKTSKNRLKLQSGSGTN